MNNQNIIYYIAANPENAAIEFKEKKGYLFDNFIPSCIFVSPYDIGIIKSSFTREKALEMILPSKRIEVDKDSTIDTLLNVHVLVEMGRCFELIILREIPGPVPSEWVKTNINDPVLYLMKSHPEKFDMDSLSCKR